MPLPAWLDSQLAAAQAETENDGTTWSAFVTTDDGLAPIVGAHDQEHAQRWLDESGGTGFVARSRRAS
ncbi:hypothetical protein E4N62_24815 [Streptomyces sp. MNU76]|uniref:hypothetical protein n=1 Tax=Streptomyces sp. MNU76 TaxID=2560026 RepID=UPI001E3D56BA|nr:hypothetical protein [Streptomyces sp. MNU76]MCC9708194.1 hypothetical protein [Streptomyces sp. MNU76]